MENQKLEIKLFPERGITKQTLEFYGVQSKFADGSAIETGFPYPAGYHKIRRLGDDIPKRERYYHKGTVKDGLFGKDKFDIGSKKTITITEGEYDALTVYQLTRGETAATSVRSSVAAVKDCKADWDYINSFEKIILCFDGDEAGQRAATSVASLFDFKKVYQVKLVRHKDANAYLIASEGHQFYETWKNARRYTPDSIISSFNEIEASLKESQEDIIGTYPLARLQSALFGLSRGEVIVFKGDEGIGKTEIFRAMEHHLLKTTNLPIGIIHLEEDNGTTVKAIATYELKEPVISPDAGVGSSEILQAYKDAVAGDESRVFIHTSFDVDDANALLDNIRFLVSGCGCGVVFLDHISWLATGDPGEDERKKLDSISQRLKLLAKELKFCLCMISHVNDDGKTRGSRNITKVANTVIHMSRDKTADDPAERMRTYFTIEKARLQGARTGPAGYGVYDYDTGTLNDMEDI